MSLGNGLPLSANDLPAFARAQARDMRDVVTGVPLVHGEIESERDAATFGMVEAALKIVVRHGLEKDNETLMQAGDEGERWLN